MLIKLGNWLFHYRNYLFPVFYGALFIPSPDIFPKLEWALLTGSLFIIFGIITRSVTIGLVYIRRGGLNRQIYADTLVVEGIYKVCRNPMYLGNITLLLGFGFFANSFVFLLFFFPLFCLFYIAIIQAEEEFLVNKFSVQYEAYKNSTNAILPEFGKLQEAFRGHSFDLKKVINKEHNSLFVYFLGIMSLLLYQHLLTVRLYFITVAIMLVIYLWVKFLKSHNKL